MALFPCVACGFLVFEESIGSYAICPICRWEDDHVQLRYPGSPIGANHVSLYEYQQTIVLPRVPPEVAILRDTRRLPSWRPLRSDEAQASTDEPQSGQAYFLAAGENDSPYYWENTKPPAS
jgi:hypothetical protein